MRGMLSIASGVLRPGRDKEPSRAGGAVRGIPSSVSGVWGPRAKFEELRKFSDEILGNGLAQPGGWMSSISRICEAVFGWGMVSGERIGRSADGMVVW